MAASNLRVMAFGTSSRLDVFFDPDEGSGLPPQDPSSMGLLQAIWSATFAMTESAALWLAMSPRTWAEIGDAYLKLARPPEGGSQTALPGPVNGYREPPLSPLPFTMPSALQPDDLAVTV